MLWSSLSVTMHNTKTLKMGQLIRTQPSLNLSFIIVTWQNVFSDEGEWDRPNTCDLTPQPHIVWWQMLSQLLHRNFLFT